MAAFTKFQPFVENLAEGAFDFTSDATCTITVALTNAANPPLAADGVLTDQVVIAYTYLSARVVAVTSSAQTAGVYKLTLTDLVITCSGGTAAAFQYVVLYDDDATSDELIGFYDYGSEVTLNDGDTFTIDFDDSNGVLTIT